MLSPEDMQHLTNLQQRMLDNKAKGLPSHEGISEDEIKRALATLRSGAKTAAASAGGKAKAKKTSAKNALNTPERTKSAQELFGDTDFD